MCKVDRVFLISTIVLISVLITLAGCSTKPAAESTTTSVTPTSVTTTSVTTTTATVTNTTTTSTATSTSALYLTPPIGATDISITLTFTWPKVTGTIVYEFAIAEERGNADKFATIDFQTTTPTNSYTLTTELKHNTTYWWRVRSVGEAGIKGSWSVGSFTTINK